MKPRRRGTHRTPADEILVFRELVKRRTIHKPEERASHLGRAFAFLATFFLLQAWFASNPAKRKAALCTRRAGKSTALAGILLDAAIRVSDTTCIYIALTRKQAKRIMWKELVRLDRLYSLGLKFNKTDLTATLRNGSTIHVCGATDDRDIDRLRGEPFLVAVIDEAGAFPEDLLDELIDEVLEPATLDFDGQILLVGTPTSTLAGLFYRATTGDLDKDGNATPFWEATAPPAGWANGDVLPQSTIDAMHRKKGWAVHRWTLHDNPYVPKKGSRFKTAEEWLTWLRENRNIPANSPKYLREYCGKWVQDQNSLVYGEIREACLFETVPGRRGTDGQPALGKRLEGLPRPAAGGDYAWRYGLGVDLGYDDPCAIALMAWCEELPEIYCAELFSKSGMVISEIAAKIKEVRRRIGAHFVFVVIDQGGGSGKMVSEELRGPAFGIDCEGAEKTKKETFLRFANADFRAGRLKIVGPACPGLFDQLRALQWDAKKAGKEDPRFANDKADAFLYAYRAARAIHFHDVDSEEPEELKPEADSKEAHKRTHEKLRERVERKLKEQKRQTDEWWDPR